MTNNKVLVYSYRTAPADDTVVFFAKENMTQIDNETRRWYVSTEAFEETRNQFANEQRTQAIEETQSQSPEKQKSQDFGKIQSQSSKRQRTLLGFDAQEKQGQRSQAFKGNSFEHLEVRTKVLHGTYSKSSKEISPWFPDTPDVKETKDQSADKSAYTESTSKDYEVI